jgi:hypothetical protein
VFKLRRSCVFVLFPGNGRAFEDVPWRSFPGTKKPRNQCGAEAPDCAALAGVGMRFDKPPLEGIRWYTGLATSIGCALINQKHVPLSFRP